MVWRHIDNLGFRNSEEHYFHSDLILLKKLKLFELFRAQKCVTIYLRLFIDIFSSKWKKMTLKFQKKLCKKWENFGLRFKRLVCVLIHNYTIGTLEDNITVGKGSPKSSAFVRLLSLHIQTGFHAFFLSCLYIFTVTFSIVTCTRSHQKTFGHEFLVGVHTQ